MVRISSFSSLDSSLASWVLLSSLSSSVSERLEVSKRRSSRVWLRNGDDEWRLGGRIWSLPIRVWKRRLSKLGVLLNELMIFGID